MTCGVQGDRLVLRLGPAGAAAALRQPHTSPMEFTGKALASMVYVERPGWQDDARLRRWTVPLGIACLPRTRARETHR